MHRKDYLEYLGKACSEGRRTYDAQIKKWQDDFEPMFMFGYNSPGIIAAQIHMEGLLYKLNGDMDHARFVRKGLLQVPELASIFPEEIRLDRVEYKKGVPLMDPLFQLHAYMNAYLYIKDSGVLDKEDEAKVFQAIDQTVSTLEYYPEWGAHNRSMLRACAFVQARAVLGENPDTLRWEKLAAYLAEESIGRWSIEDTPTYMALWLFACIMYAKWTGTEEEYYKKLQTKFYFDYITELLTPEGQIPGFGDAFFHFNWHIWAACLEKGAAVYRCPAMKAAAHRMFRYGQRTSGEAVSPSIGSYCVYAYEWGDDTVEPGEIPAVSADLDELVGKKIIFRDEHSYMLYNYRDEGYHGYIPRRYLRTSIPVKAEKMHHGHGDEGSIIHLEKKGSILLHDGGYRDRLPNGKYRADLYHNRLIFREGLRDATRSAYDALHDEGYYRRVDTEKLHFQSFGILDHLRTRTHVRPLDFIWDRSVTWLKSEDAYIIVDWVDGAGGKDLTIGNLWHAQTAEPVGDKAFEARVDTIYRGQNDANPFRNDTSHSLLIEFITGQGSFHAEPIRRNHGDACMVSQCFSRSFNQDGREILVTLLTAHERSIAPEAIAGRLRIEREQEDKSGLSLVYEGKQTIHLAYKLDLDRNLIHYVDDRSPMYNWETGKIEHGTITSDADFCFVRESGDKLDYGMVNGCRIHHGGRPIFSTPQYTANDYLVQIFSRIDHKWKAWEGTAER